MPWTAGAISKSGKVHVMTPALLLNSLIQCDAYICEISLKKKKDKEIAILRINLKMLLHLCMLICKSSLISKTYHGYDYSIVPNRSPSLRLMI